MNLSFDLKPMKIGDAKIVRMTIQRTAFVLAWKMRQPVFFNSVARGKARADYLFALMRTYYRVQRKYVWSITCGRFTLKIVSG